MFDIKTEFYEKTIRFVAFFGSSFIPCHFVVFCVAQWIKLLKKDSVYILSFLIVIWPLKLTKKSFGLFFKCPGSLLTCYFSK